LALCSGLGCRGSDTAGTGESSNDLAQRSQRPGQRRQNHPQQRSQDKTEYKVGRKGAEPGRETCLFGNPTGRVCQKVRSRDRHTGKCDDGGDTGCSTDGGRRLERTFASATACGRVRRQRTFRFPPNLGVSWSFWGRKLTVHSKEEPLESGYSPDWFNSFLPFYME
jgi:hypothetical protein